MQKIRKIITFCTTCSGNLCLPGLLVLADPFWGRKRRNCVAAAPDKCDELPVLSSLGRMLFLMNTEDTSPSR